MKTPLIIEKPELQGTVQRTFYSLITAAAWTLWFYLLLPALSIVAWLFGLRLFFDEVVMPTGGQAWSELAQLGVFVLFAALAVVTWSQYNLRRYGRRNRRTRIPELDETTQAEFYDVSMDTLHRLRSERLLTLDYTGDHHPVIVDEQLEAEEASALAGVEPASDADNPQRPAD